MGSHNIYQLASNSDEKNYQYQSNTDGDTRWEDFTANDATPDIDSWNQYFKTANTGSTTITDFVNSFSQEIIPDGHEIWVLVNDANTTFDFTGSSLTGNGGADLAAAAGTLMHAIFDGEDNVWRCFLSTPS